MNTNKNNFLKRRDLLKSSFQKCMKKIFLSLINSKYSNVLDIGCGKGYWSYIGAKNNKFENCFASDTFDDFQKDEIKDYCNNVQYKNISNDNMLPFGKEMFDLIFSLDVIEHVENDSIFLSEQLRVCKNNGKIIIGTPNYYRITNLFLLLFGKLKFPRVLGNDSYGPITHIREYKKEELLTLIKKYEKFIDTDSVKIIPCWLGILPLNIGFSYVPRIFTNFCQFWFIEFNKKRSII